MVGLKDDADTFTIYDGFELNTDYGRIERTECNDDYAHVWQR